MTGRIPDRRWKKNFWAANKASWCKQGKKGGTYVEQIAYESCLEGNQLKAFDSINFAIGQGDVLVTPIQMATAYSAISNGGTLYNPTVGKAVISPDGKHVEMIKPQAHGRLPIDARTVSDLDKGLRSVVEPGGTAAWRFGGWPLDKIPMRAKTGTAQVYGKQTTSWLATYTDDFAIVMTISQGGTGSGASGPAVRNLYNAIYGLDMEGKQDVKKALLLKPETKLPRILPDGSIESPDITPYVPPSPEALVPPALAGPPPHGRTEGHADREQVLRIPLRTRARRDGQAHRPRLGGALLTGRSSSRPSPCPSSAPCWSGRRPATGPP